MWLDIHLASNRILTRKIQKSREKNMIFFICSYNSQGKFEVAANPTHQYDGP